MAKERRVDLTAEIKQLEEEIEEKHEANEKRFDKLENRMSEISSQVKIIIVLLIANGAVNFAHLFFGKG